MAATPMHDRFLELGSGHSVMCRLVYMANTPFECDQKMPESQIKFRPIAPSVRVQNRDTGIKSETEDLTWVLMFIEFIKRVEKKK